MPPDQRNQRDRLERLLLPVWMRKITGFLLIVLNLSFWGFMIYTTVELFRDVSEFAFLVSVSIFPFFPVIYLLQETFPFIILYVVLLSILLIVRKVLRRITKDSIW